VKGDRDSLKNLMYFAAAVRGEVLEFWRSDSDLAGRDFYTAVAGKILGVDYCDVMRSERAAVKAGLYICQYERQPATTRERPKLRVCREGEGGDGNERTA
jgi:hypothetical protein